MLIFTVVPSQVKEVAKKYRTDPTTSVRQSDASGVSMLNSSAVTRHFLSPFTNPSFESNANSSSRQLSLLRSPQPGFWVYCDLLNQAVESTANLSDRLMSLLRTRKPGFWGYCEPFSEAVESSVNLLDRLLRLLGTPQAGFWVWCTQSGCWGYSEHLRQAFETNVTQC